MRKKCIIYNRVSTKHQAQDGESLESQARNCLKFAKKRNFAYYQLGLICQQ